MIISNEREKLLNAAIYFARQTENCSKTKLLKLLFLLDFEHFKLTGRNVTGLTYFALPKGPVPIDLYVEFDEPAEDFSAALELTEEDYYGKRRLLVRPKAEFNDSLFSKREFFLLKDIATRYRNQNATEMVEVTHAEEGAWDRVWADGAGKGKPIPYELSLENHPNREYILAMAREHQAFIAGTRRLAKAVE